jgi:hypothetical protein
VLAKHDVGAAVRPNPMSFLKQVRGLLGWAVVFGVHQHEDGVFFSRPLAGK